MAAPVPGFGRRLHRPGHPANRKWYRALEAAGIDKRGPYCLRHTFATEALAAGISTFELSRVIGTSIAMIDRHYGHLARDSEQAIRARHPLRV
jgi:integrase